MPINTNTSLFPVLYSDILDSVQAVDPINYGLTRNYIDGAVSYLSPYISRGVISTKFVLSKVLDRGYNVREIEKFIQELAWRDYWQQIWIEKGDTINSDLKHAQLPVSNTLIPKAVFEAKTGINAIDNAIKEFYKTGYLHNHLRMYIASITCNVAGSHWKYPAHWMYYHLLDADWASNALSWQWVAGANANKKYVANQENINKYCSSEQQNTFLDIAYEDFSSLTTPNVLKETVQLGLKTSLPIANSIFIDNNLPTCIYNFYNLDPLWKKDELVNKVLLLEPSVFSEYPISQKTINFMLSLAQENIPNIQIYIGEFNNLVSTYNLSKEIIYKEHPLNKNYKGIQEPREWMFQVKGYYPSFFAFWKKCKKELLF
ncbi:deoxyribodipyrimidine photolyase [Cellulophaga baltica]|uniref:FAD-binding domain-containing protein n=1 Tax=Cellulophaga TaxID=104264 RepID=UPI001C06B40E|nr:MULTISPECIES: FAD-binding domain-containing protein [Cellulophaga]MBU2996798.1 deoxyribodipyrimidine photolyase [Cellulophaga baltica]MDO6768194.1 FAD-binding domain-containing protein [Cellulophaga sp. 1_MG-2023]